MQQPGLIERQQMPQQQPEQMPQGQAPQNGQQGAYPANPEQMEKFFLGMVKEIHSTEVYSKALADDRAPVGVKIGALAAKALANMFTRVKEQTGMKPQRQLVVMGIRVVVSELTEMAKKMGLEVTKKDMQQAANLAGDNLDETMRGQNGRVNQ